MCDADGHAILPKREGLLTASTHRSRHSGQKYSLFCFLKAAQVESAKTPAGTRTGTRTRTSGTAAGCLEPCQCTEAVLPSLPDPNDPIRSPRSSTHPLVCLSRMERSSISDLHHLTASLRHLIEALNGNQRSLTHNCQREALEQPRVCICVSGRKGNGTSTDTCAINPSLAAEHKVVLQQRTRQRMLLSSLALCPH